MLGDVPIDLDPDWDSRIAAECEALGLELRYSERLDIYSVSRSEGEWSSLFTGKRSEIEAYLLGYNMGYKRHTNAKVIKYGP